MFIVREYAVCLLVVLFVGALLLAGGGIFFALRAGCRVVAKILHSTRGVRARGAGVAIIASVAFVFFLIILLSVARADTPPESGSGQSGEYTFRVSVDQVVLHATVLNSRGAPVSGLGKENFQIYEDGVLQETKYFSHDDVPVEVGLIIDNSGSMRPKRAEVIAAALAFARSSNPQDQMFVVHFNERVSFGLPESMLFTDKVAELEVALSGISADGETALYDAVAAGLDHLKEGNRDKKVLIVISDGGDNASKHTKAQILILAGQSDTILYAIGLRDENDPDQHFDVLKQLAKAAGGEAFLPESLKDVTPICERIAHDIRSQYTLAYVSTNRKQDGTYRALQVKVSAPGRGRMSVRTRAGYFAPLKPQAAVDSPSSRP
jgi:VWFA-related protein